MNRTPWDEELIQASNHLVDLQNRSAKMQGYIAMGLSDGCLPVTEEQLEHMEEAMKLFLEHIRIAMNHREKQTMVINDPAIGEQPLYPDQPTYCEKYVHPYLDPYLASVCPLCRKKI